MTEDWETAFDLYWTSPIKGMAAQNVFHAKEIFHAGWNAHKFREDDMLEEGDPGEIELTDQLDIPAGFMLLPLVVLIVAMAIPLIILILRTHGHAVHASPM